MLITTSKLLALNNIQKLFTMRFNAIRRNETKKIKTRNRFHYDFLLVF